MSARPGKPPHVDERADPVGRQQRDEVAGRMRRVPDGVHRYGFVRRSGHDRCYHRLRRRVPPAPGIDHGAAEARTAHPRGQSQQGHPP